MAIDPQALLDKIKSLPADRLAAIDAFVDSIADSAGRKQAFDRLLAVAPAIEAAGIAPPTEGEIVAEVKAVRMELRRSRATGP